jgi:hypothetical protein
MRSVREELMERRRHCVLLSSISQVYGHLHIADEERGRGCPGHQPDIPDN